MTSVSLLEALRKPAAADLVSRVNLPSRDQSAMDGYAFRRSDLICFGRLRVSSELLPSTKSARRLVRGEAAYVATGAPIPAGADTVARVEACRVTGEWLTIQEKIPSGKDIQRRGTDVRKGEVVVRKGELLTPYHVDLLSSTGATKVRIFKPKVAIMAIGDELTTFNKVRPGGTPDSISVAILGLASFADLDYLGVVPDDKRQVSAGLRAAASSADMIVTIGGTSVGKFDFTKEAVAAEGRLFFEGVSVNTLKRGAVGEVRGRPVVMLPGQVVSAVVSFHEHALHVISRMVGRELREYDEARLAEEINVHHRMDSVFLFQVKNGIARPLPWGVGLHQVLIRANAFGVLKSHSSYDAGSTLILQRLMR